VPASDAPLPKLMEPPSTPTRNGSVSLPPPLRASLSSLARRRALGPT
jgi:hypothetical protein